MSLTHCPASLTGDHSWPDELDQDAWCLICGLLYSELSQYLGGEHSHHEFDLLEELLATAEEYLGRSLDSDDLSWLAGELTQLVPPDLEAAQ